MIAIKRAINWGYVCAGLALLLLLGASVATLWWACHPPPPDAAVEADEGEADDGEAASRPSTPELVTRLTAPGGLPPSPLDALDRAAIPENARRPGLPDEVVAVVGSWKQEQQIRGAGVIAGSSDGRVAAGQRRSTLITLHDAQTFRLLESLPCPTGLVRMAFSGDGKLLAAGGVGWVGVWRTDQLPARPLGMIHWDGVTAVSVAVSADGNWLAAGGGWCAMEPRPRGTAEQEELHRKNPLLLTPYAKLHGGWLSLWRVDSAGLTPWLQAMNRPRTVTALAFAGDGARLASGEEGGTLALWRIPDEPQDKLAPREKAWTRACLGAAGVASCATAACLVVFWLVGGHVRVFGRWGPWSAGNHFSPCRGARVRHRLAESVVVFGAVCAILAVAALVQYGTCNSDPNEARPWRATRGLAAVSIAFTDEAVVWCGVPGRVLDYSLGGRRSSFPGLGEPGEGAIDLQVFRWHFSGGGVARPLSELLLSPVGIAVLAGTVVGSVLPWLILGYLSTQRTLSRGDFLKYSFGGLLLGSLPMLVLVYDFNGDWLARSIREWFSDGPAWRCWVAFALAWAVACVLGWQQLLKHLDKGRSTLGCRPSLVPAAKGWVITLALLTIPAYGLMLVAPYPQLTLSVDSCVNASAALSADGETLTVVVWKEKQQHVETWDLASGVKTSSVPARGGVVARLDLAPDGALLVEGLDYFRPPIVARAMSQELPAKEILPDVRDLWAMCFVGPSKLAHFTRNFRRMTDLLTGAEQKLSADFDRFGGHLVASDDGKVLAMAGLKGDVWRVYLWDLPKTNARELDLGGSEIERLAISADGRRLAAISQNDSGIRVQVVDVATGKETARHEIPVEGRTASALALNPDGTAVAFASSGHLMAWDLSNRPPVDLGACCSTERGRNDLRFTSDGKRLMLADDGWRFQFVPPKPVSIVQLLNEPVEPVKWDTPAAMNETQRGLAWDWPGLRPGRPFRFGGGGPILAPDGRLVASWRNGCLLVEDCATGKRILRRPLPVRTGAPSLAPDGRHLAVGLDDGTVMVLRLYDAQWQRLLAACNAVLARDPRNVEVLARRGGLHLEAGRPAEALADARAALAAEPAHRGALHLLGLACARGKDPAGAVGAFDELIRLDDKDALAWYRRGLAHADRGDIARARSDLERALRLDPALAAPPAR